MDLPESIVNKILTLRPRPDHLYRFEDRFIDYGNRYRVYYKTFGFDQNEHRDDYIIVKKNPSDYLEAEWKRENEYNLMEEDMAAEDAEENERWNRALAESDLNY